MAIPNIAVRKVRLEVSNRIVLRSSLPPEIEEKIVALFTHANPAYASAKAALERPGLGRQARAIAYARAKSEPRTIETWKREADGTISFPRGGIERIRETFAEYGLVADFDDARSDGDPELAALLEAADFELKLEPRGYQAEALAAWVDAEQGIVRAPTGSGKTLIGCAAIDAVRLPTIVLVDSKSLAEQWTSRLRGDLGLDPRLVGMLGDGKRRVGPVTVAISDTARRMLAELADRFGLAIFDEVHGAAAKTAYELVDALRARYRLGMSDDERRKDRKEFLIRDAFGEVVAKIDRNRIVEEGAIFDVDVDLFDTGVRVPWWQELPEAARQYRFEELVAELSEHDERNALLVELALVEVEAGNQVLVFAHRREHCADLADRIAAAGVRSGLLLGGVGLDAREFQRTLAGLFDGSVRVGVGTYEAIGKGLDLPAVSRGILATPCHTNRTRFQQARGRLARRPEGKRDAKLWAPWDRKLFGRSPVEAAARMAPRSAFVVDEARPGSGRVLAKAWLRERRGAAGGTGDANGPRGGGIERE